MAIRRATSLINGRQTAVPAADKLANVGSSYVGTTRRSNSEIDNYFGTGVTDSNGRITFNLTVDGTPTGTAIFSSILNVSAITKSNSTVISNLPNFFLESISSDMKQIVLRGTASQSGLVLLGVGVSQVAFVGAGITGLVAVAGLP